MSGQDRRPGDLYSAIAAYDLWSFLAWQDIKIRYRRSLVSQRWEEGLLNRILTGYRPVLQFAQQG